MKPYLALLLLALSQASHAHYVWLEKTATEAQLYFGEWHNAKIEHSEKLARFSDAQVFVNAATKPLKLTMQETYLQATLQASAGDARMMLESLPAKENRHGGGISKTSYYAKAGRSDTSARLPLELVPLTANGNKYQLLFKQKPLARTAVVVYGPPKWEKHLKTDKEGKLSFDTPWAGMYLIKISHEIPAVGVTPTLEDPTLRYKYTATFEVKDGIFWKQ